jgi:hypothetical protein
MPLREIRRNWNDQNIWNRGQKLACCYVKIQSEVRMKIPGMAMPHTVNPKQPMHILKAQSQLLNAVGSELAALVRESLGTCLQLPDYIS